MSTRCIQSAIELYRQQAIKAHANSGMESGESDPKVGHWEFDNKFEELRDCVGKSFAGTNNIAGEPVMAWAGAHLKQLKGYSAEDHLLACTFIMGFPIYESLCKRHTLVVAKREYNENKGSAGELASVGIVMEYDPSKQKNGLVAKIVKTWRAVMAFVKMWMRSPIPSLFVDNGNKEAAKIFIKRDRAMLSEAERAHKEEGPHFSHWCVHIVAVNPDYHGKGYGRELMEKINELGDNAGATMYLECGMSNVKFYQKMGYELQATKTVEDPMNPKDKPGRIAMMVRKAQ